MTPQNELRELEARVNEYRNRVLAQSGDGAYLKAVMSEIMKDAGHDYRRIALALANPPTCKWRYDESSCSYDTGCGQKHCFIDGGPKENDHHFCPYCGHTIEEVNE